MPGSSVLSDPVAELKTRAEILHHRIQKLESRAIERLRALPRYRRWTPEQLAAEAPQVRRRHCLAVIAAECGFPDWPAARGALTGAAGVTGFGTLLCPERCSVHLNRWYVRYEEAAADRAASGGYLLAYRRQYLVVDRHFIESLGLDPDDADWRALGFDWVRPLDAQARARLYGKLIAGLPRPA